MASHFIHIVSLARLIFIDGLRRHALMGLVIFALAAEAGGLLFFDFIPRDISRASNDFLFSIYWVVGIIFLLFHCVHVAAWDDGRRVIHTILARPISRTEYVFGLYLGLALLLLFLNLCLSGIGWLILSYIKGSVSAIYFEHLSFPLYFVTTLGIYCIELMILAVILLFAGAVRGNFPVLLLSLSYYLICSGLPVVRESAVTRVVEGSGGLVVILKWMTAIFPDFSRLDFKMLVTVVGKIPSLTDFLSVFGFSILYIVIILWLSSLLYQRRDLQ